ncbi:MAG: hypothetical protein PF481_08115 [Bacteroidales bacterium]|jgi:hypothetical protein|nr:hypothetical protein [Bacteroidales bacterium]
MEKSKIPFGVKRADNGSIGEARTKSFLIDRFWILERSVDIEGADFIIQRKLTEKSILDTTPPRFGIIQAKFSQDNRTQHEIKKKYVVDKDQNPHYEFFLIVNVGFEESQQMFLLSSNDIINNFEQTSDGDYKIPTSKIIDKFQIKNKKDALDYIENGIQCAEFYKNRTLIFNNLNFINPDFDAIHPDYKMDIEYCDGNVPEIFKEYKEKAYSFVCELENMHEILLKFIQEANPLESCYLAEEFDHYFGQGVSVPQIFDKSFYLKAKRYIEQINYLRNDGILGNFLSVKNIIRNKVNEFLLLNNNVIDSKSKLIVLITYNTTDFNSLRISNKLTSEVSLENEKYQSYILLSEGQIESKINIGISCANGSLPIQINECCLIDMVEKIYELKYFEIENKA